MKTTKKYWWWLEDGGIATAPNTQATNITFTNITDTTVTISWTRGNGSAVLIVAKSGGAVDSNPVDDTTYTDSSVLGSGSEIGTGNYVVYKGVGTSLTITGIAISTAIHVRAYEFNGGPGVEKYNTNTATGNPANATTFTEEYQNVIDYALI